MPTPSPRRPGRSLALMLLAALALAGLWGCSVAELRPDEPERYTLTTPAPPAGLEAAEAGVLLVENPGARAAIDSARIRLRTGANRLDYFAGRAWAEPAPDMLGELIEESLEAVPGFAAVISTDARLRGDRVLRTELRHFEAVYDGPVSSTPPEIHVALRLYLVDPRAREIIASHDVELRRRADSPDFEAIIAAFDAAAAEALGHVARWVARWVVREAGPS